MTTHTIDNQPTRFGGHYQDTSAAKRPQSKFNYCVVKYFWGSPNKNWVMISEATRDECETFIRERPKEVMVEYKIYRWNKLAA